MSDVHARLREALAGRYRLERKLGEGGMATVYLAEDIRHQRKVALKLLRPELAAILGAERFLMEIKTTANLQHPHILPLHDSGTVESTVFYVMPFVAGESLRDRLKREKQLPVDEAIRIASEVASALDYAHRHGVIHRDIKPENILLHDGTAMVADFGIALAAATTGGTRMTETGMSLGTPTYMSPEQAMGEREITARSDVYALGVVLYEMLTGDPPFTGSTVQAIVARVVTEAPRSLSAQRHTVPEQVEAAVLTALEKLPADRFGSAGEFARALSGAGAVRPRLGLAPAPAGGGWKARLALPMTALAVLTTMLALLALFRSAPPAPVSRYRLAFPSRQAPGETAMFTISPDGGQVVYSGPRTDGSGGTQLWVKRRDRSEATPLAATDDADGFAISADGDWIAFGQHGGLKKLPIQGGSPVTLADSALGYGSTAWLEDGSVVYAHPPELRRIRGTGGTPETLWTEDSAGTAVLPTALPADRGVLFIRCRAGSCRRGQALWVLNLRSGEARELLQDVARAWYVSSGHLIYVRPDGDVFAVPFDLGALAIEGPPVPVLENVTVLSGPVVPLLAISPSGSVLFRAGGGSVSGPAEMVWVDRAGRPAPLDTAWLVTPNVSGGNRGWSLSPDGSRLAIGLRTDEGDDIWIKRLPAGPLSRLSFDSGPEMRPRWSSDGRYVLFISGKRDLSYDLMQRRADGTGGDEPLLALPERINEGLWSPDGRWLVFRTGGEATSSNRSQAGGRDIRGFRPGVDSAPVPLAASPQFDEAAPAISPDGRWLAYESDETGRTEIYLRPFPATDRGKWQVSTGGGQSPVWARNGRELFYVDGARDMIVVPIRPGAVPGLGAPRRLFTLGDELLLDPAEHYPLFDVSPDSRRFVMARRARLGRTEPAPLVMVEHWFTELRAAMGNK